MAKEIYLKSVKTRRGQPPEYEPVVEDRDVIDGKKVVTNTSKMIKEDPLMAIAFLKGGIDSTPAQERNGQMELINSDTIPTKFNGRENKDAELIKMGFKLGKVVESDPIFRYCELPTGWKKERGENPLWTYILDENGNQRMSVFYKAAFYDREAFFNLIRRFFVASDFADDDSLDKQYMIRDKANEDKPLLVTGFNCRQADYPDDDDGKRAYYRKCDAISEEMDAKLKTYFPNHKDPLAYWGKEGDDIIENSSLRG